MPSSLRAGGRSGNSQGPLRVVGFRVRLDCESSSLVVNALHDGASLEENENLKGGRQPLHGAAANSSSVEIAECLADSWPQAALGEKSCAPNDGGALPVHLAAGRMFPNSGRQL